MFCNSFKFQPWYLQHIRGSGNGNLMFTFNFTYCKITYICSGLIFHAFPKQDKYHHKILAYLKINSWNQPLLNWTLHKNVFYSKCAMPGPQEFKLIKITVSPLVNKPFLHNENMMVIQVTNFHKEYKHNCHLVPKHIWKTKQH